MSNQEICLTREQYTTLEALCACAKVSRKTHYTERTPYFDQDMEGRLSMLAEQADMLEIPWSLQNQVYFQAGLDPWSYNHFAIARAVEIVYKRKLQRRH